MTGDKVWQWEYQILILVLSIGAAVLATYLIERPVANRLLNGRKRKAEAPQ